MKLCLTNLTIVVKHILTIVVKHKLTTFVKHKLTMFVKNLTIIVKHWLTIFRQHIHSNLFGGEKASINKKFHFHVPFFLFINYACKIVLTIAN